MSRLKICLIGGTGFIGRPLARRLMALGHDVSIITRHRERHRRMLIHPTLKLIQGDVFDDAVLNKHFDGVDLVFNLTGILNQYRGHEHRFDTVHTELPRRIAQACVATGVRRMIQLSALGADPDGPSEYQRSKGRGEQELNRIADQHGLGITVFRPSVVFGAEDQFINRFASLLKSAPIMPLACPDAKFQPVAIEDVIAALINAVNDPTTTGQSYDLVGPEVYTLEQLVRYIDGIIGSQTRIFRLGPRLSKILATVLQFAPGKPLTPDNVASMSVDNVSDQAFVDLFGVEPTRLEQSVPVFLRAATDRLDALRRRRG